MDRSRRDTPAAGLIALAAFVAAAAFAVTSARAADLGAPELPAVWTAAEPGITAPAFRWSGDAETHARAVDCLAAAVYYEAANQPLDGRQAVAQVVLNRVRHPSYPKSVCGVVYQGAPDRSILGRGCQFTFACDGSRARTPDARAWRDAEDVAEQALGGFVAAAVGASTHYHTLAVRPAWSAALTPTVRIGAHQFYRFPGPGDATGLSAVYAGIEPAGVRPVTVALLRRRGGRGLVQPPAPSTPQAAEFSVWGLQVARVSPDAGGVAVSQPAN